MYEIHVFHLYDMVLNHSMFVHDINLQEVVVVVVVVVAVVVVAAMHSCIFFVGALVVNDTSPWDTVCCYILWNGWGRGMTWRVDDDQKNISKQ